MNNDIKKEINELRASLEHHIKQYYLYDSPEISDFEYDALMRRLKELEENYPEFDDPLSPSKRVGGAVLDKFEKVTHAVPMKSLSNIFSLEDIRDFVNKNNEAAGEKCEYVVELGRKPKNNNTSIPNNYLYVTSSNKIESPNGHVLFEKAQKTLYYRDVKTNKTYSKDVANLEIIKYFGRIYNVILRK